jgi:hypothetical protein
MAALRNIFACLVHESQDCISDLVRNLRFLDPASTILLYNGGQNPDLLTGGFPFERYGAIVHPSPKSMAWGCLHEFALDCMRFALDYEPFDTLTIVDSDQLGTRAGYSEYLRPFLENRNAIGLFSSSPGVMTPDCRIAPAQAALQEIDLWRPFLQRFPDGESKFVHWSFWPSTVFTENAARDLTRLFASDEQLQDIISRSKIWATEEIILPTLTALLGYEIAANPCSYDYVKYRAVYSPGQIDELITRKDVYWVHPIPRRYDDPLRCRLRTAFNDYQDAPRPASDAKKEWGLVLSIPILQRMKSIEGWLEEDEADLLIAAVSRAITSLAPGVAVVEIGSFCGRGTVVLGSVVKSLGTESLVYAIDAYDGKVGALDQGLQCFRPTLDAFRRNISENGLNAVVRAVPSLSTEVTWDKSIGFLLIDGHHDYASVARDFHHFSKWVAPGGCIAFHDYADYFPGVKTFVNELLRTPGYQEIQRARSLIVLRSTGLQVSASVRTAEPLVSCIMPTADRRPFVSQAIRHFLRQEYSNRELIILDDGADSIQDLIPDDERLRYIRLPQRRTMGAKHNLGCELARGEIIVHWDDDDWNAEWRITYQVKQLLQCPPTTLSGLSRLFFYEPCSRRAWEYSYPLKGRPWVSGATFCYYKSFWEEHRFPDMNEGADTVFVWNLNDTNIVALPDHSFYVATVHADNTSRKRTEGPGWRTRSTEEIRRLLDDTDWLFYEKVGLG